MKLTPNITLSTGRIITHAFMANGAQSANVLGDESAAMTDPEWDEYCELLKGVRTPPKKTFQYQIGEPGCDLDPANWQEIEACTMRDAVVPALQREAETRKVPMPSIVYLSSPDDFKHSNGSPFAVHAFEVTQ